MDTIFPKIFCNYNITNKTKNITQKSSNLWFTRLVSTFNVGFFLTKIDEIKTMSQSWIYSEGCLHSWHYIKSRTSRVDSSTWRIINEWMYDLVIKLLTCCTAEWTKISFAFSKFFIEIDSPNSLDIPWETGVATFARYFDCYEILYIILSVASL